MQSSFLPVLLCLFNVLSHRIALLFIPVGVMQLIRHRRTVTGRTIMGIAIIMVIRIIGMVITVAELCLTG